MGGSLPRSVDDLPLLPDLVAPQAWSADLVAASDGLFERGVRVLRDGEGGLLVIGDAVMRALAQDPAVGGTPVEFLTGRAGDRVRRATGAAPPSGAAAFDAFLRNQVFTMNAALHVAVRRVVARHLVPRAVLGMAGHAERVLVGVLDEVTRVGGVVDLERDVAGPYVTRFWTDQLGVPAGAALRVQQLVHEMNRMFLFAPTLEDRARVLAATEEYLELVGRTVAMAWERGDNALLGHLARGLDGIDLPGAPPDLGALVAANFFDGFHTVAVAVANAARCLLADAPAAERVRRAPSLVAAAFTEGARLTAPLMLTTRMALGDVEHAGLRIPAGTPITMAWIAANRDPEAYDEPGGYRLDRPPRLGTTFGGGARICPGRGATRMLGEVALRALTATSVQVRLESPQPGWVPGSAIRRHPAIPVVVRRVAAA
ncbi:cytochrome P450 [Pseudonocardia humida]|uniref:Cytochrome P450 n=1 Tax=Pseudonocardia humida TaxID=2800819 RepID=A0ABT0ZY72_9PSEU|nr:cytochrome P450 [Pseudonocardia humida]MCO1655687.1 cytochrome P450 [Pseudonocardia humida]